MQWFLVDPRKGPLPFRSPPKLAVLWIAAFATAARCTCNSSGAFEGFCKLAQESHLSGHDSFVRHLIMEAEQHALIMFHNC